MDFTRRFENYESQQLVWEGNWHSSVPQNGPYQYLPYFQPYMAGESSSYVEANPNVMFFPAQPFLASNDGSQQQAVPNVFMAQRILPQTFPYLSQLEPVTWTPPMQPHLNPMQNPPMVSQPAAAPPVSGLPAPPCTFVNIPILPGKPGDIPPYLVSIAVPINEFKRQPESSPSTSISTPPCSPAMITDLVPLSLSPGCGSRFQFCLENGDEESELQRDMVQTAEGLRRLTGSQEKKRYFQCKLCVSNRETTTFACSHTLHDEYGKVTCPILRNHVCKICGATGDDAHTLRYCPKRKQLKAQELELEDASRKGRYANARNATGSLITRKY